MLIISSDRTNKAPDLIAKVNIFLFWADRIKKIVVTITHTEEIINICGRREELNRLRKKTSRAVLPIIIAEIKKKK